MPFAVICTIDFILFAFCHRFGRKPLFFVAGITMFVMQSATAALTGLTFTGAAIPQQPADAMIVFICIFVACFAFSWGPLGWLVCTICGSFLHHEGIVSPPKAFL